MTKVDVFSGFLGAGKTTLIKKLIAEAYGGEKLVLIENEFGDIAIDSGFLKEAGIEITEMSSGCICCSLVGDFAEALKKVTAQFHPDRILIEPSGVGKLSDVIRAVLGVEDAELVPGCATTVVDARRAKMHKRNFGEFWCDQVKSASCIVLSRTADMSAEQLSAVVAMLREINTDAVIVTTAWDELDGKALRAAMENTDTLQTELSRLAAESDDDADDECGCHDDHDHHDHHDDHHDHHDHDDHDHHDDHDDHDHHDHDHDHDHHDHDHDHHDHHDHDHDHHDETCSCGCQHGDHDHHHDGEHPHHHGHDAGEVFMSWGAETPGIYGGDGLRRALRALDSGEYGRILRAKGYVASERGWLHFDYVPGEEAVRSGPAEVTGRLCVIGIDLDKAGLKELFNVG